MLTSLLAFFGGSVFRMLWGELAAIWTRRQEHQYEIERIKLQERLEAAQHARQLEAQAQQAALKVKVIQVAAEAQVSGLEASAWQEAVKLTGFKSGLSWVDAWNALIRPALATWAVVMITGHYCTWWALDARGWELCGAVLGIYVADRALFKRGK